MEVIPTARLPIYSWAPELEEGALRQAENCASLPVAYHHVAVMADGHQGYGVPIGAVLAFEGAISPYAVGNDIGCGMALLPTSIVREDLLVPVKTRSGAAGASARDEIMGWVQSTIPAGTATIDENELPRPIRDRLEAAYAAMEEAAQATGVPLSTSQSLKPDAGQPLSKSDFLARGRSQAGTLGAGNHFIELVAGPDEEVSVLLHSGSRGVGGLICSNFHRMAYEYVQEMGAPLPDPGLAWLPVDSSKRETDRWERAGGCYVEALKVGLDYAEANRRFMLEKVAGIIEQRFPNSVRWDQLINIHHNDAALESHYDRSVWVHRKGAVKASRGAPTITPGSMGTGTIVGEGLGNPDSFCSCSHGAGRVLSRGRARQELSLAGELQRIRDAGGKVFARDKSAVLDEMPGAYKDLDQVMRNQADLVRPLRRFAPIATYKGVERGRKRRGGRGKWRPEEER
jgi:tRNA-splicing ligase RtcB